METLLIVCAVAVVVLIGIGAYYSIRKSRDEREMQFIESRLRPYR